MISERIPLRCSIALDPAVTDKDYSDFSGLTVVGWAADGRKFVLAADNLKTLPEATVARFVARTMEFRPIVGSVEAIAAQTLFKNLIEAELAKFGMWLNIVENKEATKFGKHARISRIQPELLQGRLFIHESCSDLIKQMTEYPQSEKRDLLDSLAQHLDLQQVIGLASIRSTKYDAHEDDDDMDAVPRLRLGDFTGVTGVKRGYSHQV